MLGVENDQLELTCATQDELGRTPHHRPEIDRAVRCGEAREHGRIAGHERAYLDSEWAQGTGQCAGDVGEPAGLDQGIEFGCDR